MTDRPNIEIVTTVRIGTARKTFTAASRTTGTPAAICQMASALTASLAVEAGEWADNLSGVTR